MVLAEHSQKIDRWIEKERDGRKLKLTAIKNFLFSSCFECSSTNENNSGAFASIIDRTIISEIYLHITMLVINISIKL